MGEGHDTAATLPGGDADDGEVQAAVHRYRAHVLDVGLSTPRPTIRQLLWGDKLARMKWMEHMSSAGYGLVRAIDTSINDGQIWQTKMFKVPEDEFTEQKEGPQAAKRRKLEDLRQEHKGKGAATGTQSAKGKGGGNGSKKGLPWRDPSTNKEVCWGYGEGWCTRKDCPRAHICWICGGKHTVAEFHSG